MVILLTLFVFLCSLAILYELIYNPHRDALDYSLGRRDIGLIGLTATLVMTEFNTATLISFSSLGYLAGLKALALPGIFLIGILFYAATVSRKWKNFNGFSVADYFRRRYGKDVGVIAALFLGAAMAGFSATYLKSLTLLFSRLLPDLNEWILSAYLTVIILAMVIRRGLVSIVRTDTLAFFALIIILPWVLYVTWCNGPSGISSGATIPDPALLNMDFVISLVPLTMFSYILAPWYGQRMFAAKSANTAFAAAILAAVFVFILYSSGVLISYTLASHNVRLSDSQLSFPYALNLALQGVFYPVGYISGYLILFLVSSTTLTGVWNAMANILTDFMPKEKYNNMIPLNVFCAAVTYVLSNTLVDNILNKMILANIPVVALSFALLAGFYWPKVTRAGAYASIAMGLLTGLSFYFYFGDQGIYTYYWAWFGIPLIFIAGTVMSYWPAAEKNT